jgi:hypothetical protein
VDEIVEHVRIHVSAIRPHDRLALGVDADSAKQVAIAEEWLENRPAKVWREVDFA